MATNRTRTAVLGGKDLFWGLSGEKDCRVDLKGKYPWKRPSAIKKRTHASHPSKLYNRLAIVPTGKSVVVVGLLNQNLSDGFSIGAMNANRIQAKHFSGHLAKKEIFFYRLKIDGLVKSSSVPVYVIPA
jgi:hypothetical protein